MEVLVLDGKNYVKASKAARDLGYATDYVGQLCRSGQVDAHLIGRTWYVNQEDLSTHRVEKKRMSRTKAREYAKRSIEEHRQKVVSEQNVYTNVAIRYEKDAEALIPETRKIVAYAERAKRAAIPREEDQGDSRAVINAGEKIVMSGEINVVDVTDEPIDENTTILKPRIVKAEKQEESVLVPKVRVSPKLSAIKATTKPNFIDRLAQQDTATVENETGAAKQPLEVAEEVVGAIQVTDATTTTLPVQTPSILKCIVIILVVAIASAFSTCIYQRTTYIQGIAGTVVSTTSLHISSQEVVDFIRSKI